VGDAFRGACRENRELVAPRESLSRGGSSLLRLEQWLAKHRARLVVVILEIVVRILERSCVKDYACRVARSHCRARKEVQCTFRTVRRRFEMRIATNEAAIKLGDKLGGEATRVGENEARGG